jgi:uncharacterized membrane protein
VTVAQASSEQKARRWLGVGATGLLFGIALSATGQGQVGGWVAVAAAVAMTVGLHTFGRLGPDLAGPAKRRSRRRQKKVEEDGAA